MTIIHRDGVQPLVNELSETVRELASPGLTGLRHHSVAESVIPPGGSTVPHHHQAGEEVYVVVRGRARMTLGAESHDVGPGHAVSIQPGTFHHLAAERTGDEDLVILCTCAPAFDPDDFIPGQPTA